MATFAEATQVKRVDSHTYAVNLHEDWCIGSVPNGGYTTSVILSAVSKHFQTTLREPHFQPDCMILHLEFPQRTSAGSAEIHVTDIKRGRQTSTVQVALKQSGRSPVIGFLTHVSLAAERGLSLPTAWHLSPAAPPVASFADLVADKDPEWHRVYSPLSEFRKAAARVNLYAPRSFSAGRGVLDQWVRLDSGEKWTDNALGFAADISVTIAESYVGDEGALRYAGQREFSEFRKNWYPTLVLNIERKKKLPPEGLEWLYSRVTAKVIANGRYDLEVIMQDATGDVVATSHHVAMIVSVARNLAARGEGKSKI